MCIHTVMFIVYCEKYITVVCMLLGRLNHMPLDTICIIRPILGLIYSL